MPGVFSDFQLSDLARAVADRQTAAKQSVPHYYLSVELNLSKLMALREQLNQGTATGTGGGKGENGGDVSVLDLMVKASALAMKQVQGLYCSSYLSSCCNSCITLLLSPLTTNPNPALSLSYLYFCFYPSLSPLFHSSSSSFSSWFFPLCKVPDVNGAWMDTFVRRYEQVDSTTTLSLSFFLSLSLPSPPLLNPRPLLCDDMSRFKVLSFHPPSSLTPLILAGPVSSPHPLTPFPSFRSLLCDDINNRWTLISSWAPATDSSLQVP